MLDAQQPRHFTRDRRSAIALGGVVARGNEGHAVSRARWACGSEISPVMNTSAPQRWRPQKPCAPPVHHATLVTGRVLSAEVTSVARPAQHGGHMVGHGLRMGIVGIGHAAQQLFTKLRHARPTQHLAQLGVVAQLGVRIQRQVVRKG